MRRIRLCLVALVMLAGMAWAPIAHAASLPPIRHVFVIVLENESYSSTFGPNSPAPYLAKTLTAEGAFVPDYFGIGHASNDNYIAMISGQAPNPQNQGDCPIFNDFQPDVIGPNGQAVGTGCVFPSDVKTIADQLGAAGLTWRDYNQSMGSDPTREAAVCGHPGLNQQDHTQTATAQDQYATRHDPFVYFHSIIDNTSLCDSHVVNLDPLAHDLSSAANTPNFVFITPDLCADGHDATCADPHRPGGYAGIEQFLKTWVPRITHSPAYRQENGLLAIIFDESDTSDTKSCCGEIPGPNSPQPGIGGPGGGQTGAVLLSPCIRPGTVTHVAYNHYTLLRSEEDIFRLPHLGYAQLPGGQSLGSDVFTAGSCGASTVVHIHAPPLGSAVATSPHVRVRWSATGKPASGFTVQARQTSGRGRHRWRTLARNTKRRSVLLNGRYGATYQTRVRATSGARALSNWATATTVMPSRIPSGKYTGRWFTTPERNAWGGRVIVGASPGATYSVQFTGGSLSVVGDVGPQSGTARVTLDGKSRSIDLHAGRLRARHVLFAARLAFGRHRLQIRVLRPHVPLEGLAIANRRS